MKMQNTKVGKIIYTFIVILFLFFIQTFASKSGGFIADLFDYTPIDKDGTFMYITIHHIVQMLFGLIVIFIIKKEKEFAFLFKACEKYNRNIVYNNFRYSHFGICYHQL